MKDLYSFHATAEDLEEYYNQKPFRLTNGFINLWVLMPC